MVDEILRKNIGVDFETALQMQKYIEQLLETWKGGAQSEQIKAHRRELRNDIVLRAQSVWDATMVLDKDHDKEFQKVAEAEMALFRRTIVQARDRWAPSLILGSFLFPARLLKASKLWLPDDPDAKWPVDPTLELGTSREVLAVGQDWINRKAHNILRDLILSQTAENGATAWVKAAQDWHVRRLRNDLYSGKYLNLEYGGERSKHLHNPSTSRLNRLDVIAKKLRIDPMFPVGKLTAHEKKMAVACFNKIVNQRCAGCPYNNLLILPMGIEGIVEHQCDVHPAQFWLDDQWTLRG
jgi:hypothetical protein